MSDDIEMQSFDLTNKGEEFAMMMALQNTDRTTMSVSLTVEGRVFLDFGRKRVIILSRERARELSEMLREAVATGQGLVVDYFVINFGKGRNVEVGLEMARALADGLDKAESKADELIASGRTGINMPLLP